MEFIGEISIVLALFGARAVVALVASSALAVAQMLTERSRRLTLVAVANAVTPGKVLVDERADGSRIIVRADGPIW